MNLRIEVLLNFEGDRENVNNMLADLGQILVNYDCGNQLEGGVRSVIAVSELDYDEQELDEWLTKRADEGAFFAIPVDGEDE